MMKDLSEILFDDIFDAIFGQCRDGNIRINPNRRRYQTAVQYIQTLVTFQPAMQVGSLAQYTASERMVADIRADGSVEQQLRIRAAIVLDHIVQKGLGVFYHVAVVGLVPGDVNFVFGGVIRYFAWFDDAVQAEVERGIRF